MSIFIKPGFWEEKKLAPKHWLNLNKLIDSLLPKPAYKVYIGLLTQTGTNAPTAIVLENTLGEIIFNPPLSDGSFFVTSEGLFPVDKTFVLIGSAVDSSNAIETDGDSDIIITSRYCDSIDTGLTLRSNNVLNNTPVEIRVYN